MGNSILSKLFRGLSSLLGDWTKPNDIYENFVQDMSFEGEKEWVFDPPFGFKTLVFEEISTNCKPTRKPESRSGHRVVCEDGNLYSFGGYSFTSTSLLHSLSNLNWPAHLAHGDHKLFQELWCYNFAEDQWKRLPTFGTVPKELASHSAVLDGNYLLIFGGTGVPFGSCSSNRLHACDLRTLEWKLIETTGQPPPPQYGQAVVMDPLTKSFYVIGGTTGFDYSMDIYKLNMNTFVWETVFSCTGRGDIDAPKGRYRHEVAFDNNYIYIIGGGTAAQAFDLVHVHAFSIHSRDWKTLLTSPCNDGPIPNNYPTPRKCQECVQLGNDVFICGGYDSTNIFMDLWKLNLPTMKWTALPVQMPVPLYFHSTCLTKAGCMYIFGGVTNIEENTRTNQVFKIWLKVPKLTEMCWEALLHYNKKIKLAPQSVLMDIGIPKEFATRVHPAPPCGPSTSEHWLSDFNPSKKFKQSKRLLSHRNT